MYIFLTLIIAALTLYIYKSWRWKYRSLPSPGLCLPVIGHSYTMMNRSVIKDLTTGIWSIYGKYQRNGILYMNTFSIDSLWIGDFETLKYVFNLPEVQRRLNEGMMTLALRTRYLVQRFSETVMWDISRKVDGVQMPGILVSDGKIWTQQRRFTLKTLRDFGFGKSSMEQLIQEEVDLFKTLINQHSSEPFDFMNKLNLPILNALWKVTVGERFEYDNPRLLSIVERLTEAFKIFGNPSQALLIAYPWLAKVIPSFFDIDHTDKVLMDVIDMMDENIMKHKETLDPNEPRDFTDMMLIEIEKTTDKTSSMYGQLGMDNLKVTLFDLFLAGSETTSTTLTWAVLFMVRYPEVQRKVQEELDEVVGFQRLPSMKDKAELPYTEAVLMEIQRYANIVPMGVAHINERDITVNGHTIPANTMITPIMTEILKGDHWGDGETFRPERFLDDQGKVRRDEHFIPFSTGKRSCLGETLAKTELYLFFIGLVQHYTFLPENEGVYPTEESTFGITLLPKPFRVRLLDRTV